MRTAHINLEIKPVFEIYNLLKSNFCSFINKYIAF